ncbi:CerR family C-terminal domain-containing protein [Alteromonas flava]|uniref:CerR family C-terminal domain-containing protein n=1 Tax=Alteromonas flava TaxID=2048003 RepID=UPI000C28FE81|nr:CerR family C-terminal domain-containing protein [Alteromonas flava]
MIIPPSVIGSDILASQTAVALLEAGIDQFGQFGLKATTRHVAEQANANIASIPYYFRSKRGLYDACMHYIVDNIWQEIGPPLAHAIEQVDKLDAEQAETVFLGLIDSFCELFLQGEDSIRWSQFIMREHATPTAAYDIFYQRYYCHAQALKHRLWAQCTGQSADSDRVKVQCHAVFGQVLAFLVARESLLRGMQISHIETQHIELIRNVVKAQVKAIIQNA